MLSKSVPNPSLVSQANKMLAEKWEQRADEHYQDGKKAASVAATAKANAHWVAAGLPQMESTGRYSQGSGGYGIPRNEKYLKKIKNYKNLKRIFGQYYSAKNWTEAEKIYNGS